MLITNKQELEKFGTSHRVWQGIPGIARTKAGRTFVSFYSGEVREVYGNFAVLLKSDTDTDYGEPIAAVKKEGKYRCFDPVLWIDPLDRLWFIWNVMPGEEVYASICENPDAEVLEWSEEFYIGRGVMMNKPVVLTTAEWLFPIALWRKDIYSEFRKSALTEEDIAGAYVYKTCDNGRSFIRLGMSAVRDRSFDEHMIVELENGVLMMLVRTNYGIGVSYSYDRGKNWSEGENSNIEGPCTRFFIRRLKSGRILLINHVNFTGRNNLTALLSEDDGKTFPYTLLLDERSEVSYPDAVEGEDGYIYITYDRERGGSKNSLEEAYACAREILTAKITEQDIIQGHLSSEKGFLKNVVNKLGELSPDEVNPYQNNLLDLEAYLDYLFVDDRDVIEKIFEQDSVNCIDMAKLDSKKLDDLINRFRESGNQNREIIMKIVQLLRQAPNAKQNTYPIVEQIQDYVEKHITEEITIAEIAKEMNVSIYYISHLFKRVTGTTIVKYANELRLTKAKLLLKDTEDSINDIALRCGFNSASYFSEVFMKSEKISPSEFRKCNQYLK